MILTKKVKRGIWLFFGGLFFLNLTTTTGAYIFCAFSTQLYLIMIASVAFLSFAGVLSSRVFMSQVEKSLRD